MKNPHSKARSFYSYFTPLFLIRKITIKKPPLKPLTKKQNEIIILGQGLSGLCTAFYLLDTYNIRPIILGLGLNHESASSVGQGVVSTKGLLIPESPLFYDKMLGSHRLPSFLSRLEALSGCRIRRHQGFFEPYKTEAQFQKMASRIYRGQFTGMFGVSHIAPKALAGMLSDYHGAFYYPKDIWVNQKDLLFALKTYLTQRGAVFHGVRAVSLEVLKGGYRTHLEGGDYLDSLGLCVCVGPDSKKLLSPFGAASSLQLSAGMTLFGRGGPHSYENDIALTSGVKSLVFHEGCFALGASSFETPIEKSAAFFEEKKAQLLSSSPLFSLLDQHKKSPTSLEAKVGIRVKTKNRLPLMGYCGPYMEGLGLWVLTGLYKNGLQLAPVYGARLARAIKDGAAAHPHLNLSRNNIPSLDGTDL